MPMDPRALSFDSVLLDLDGVVYAGPHAVPGAVEALAELESRGIPFGYVTNNASRAAAEIADHLLELGLPARPEVVTTSAGVAARAMADELGAGSRVLVIGSTALTELVREAGFTVVESADDEPDALVQGFFRDITWHDIAEACVAVAAGVDWWATNRDLTMPTERGLLPGNGAFVRIVADTTGREPRVTGKPAALMLQTAAATIGGTHPIMVGDRLDTDIAGGRAAGYTSALVLTGIHDIHDALTAPAEHRPDRIIATLGDLLAPAPAATVEAHTARCGDAVVTLSGGVLSSTGPALDAAAAALALLAEQPADTAWEIDPAFPRRADG
ncbi:MULTISPECIES: HAD-IIA family hydrolase [Brevibacterium]|uniref:HAD-IIA family hydrolase n=1 Tax=Brevibacterium pityocampae TaxID=506594 RepID=A0ABP8JRH3_9MICO|nr:HAD-IIA family hydrolase [Brevibacterium sp. CS2]